MSPNWVRKGECNMCGWCCKFTFDPVAIFVPTPTEEMKDFLKVRGFQAFKSRGEEGLGQYGAVYLPCPKLKDNKCSIHETRPQMCRDFPLRPSQVVNTPCSYWFEDSNGIEKPVGGDGSPHPAEGKDLSIWMKLDESL